MFSSPANTSPVLAVAGPQLQPSPPLAASTRDILALFNSTSLQVGASPHSLHQPQSAYSAYPAYESYYSPQPPPPPFGQPLGHTFLPATLGPAQISPSQGYYGTSEEFPPAQVYQTQTHSAVSESTNPFDAL